MQDDKDISDDSLLYHYCSSSSFIDILSRKTIRLSDLTMSNDAREGEWATSVLIECLKEKGVRPSLVNLMMPMIMQAVSDQGQLGFCMSEEPDLLSQWRGYADDGRGFCIGLSAKSVKFIIKDMGKDGALGANIARVRYNYEDQKHLINTILALLDKISDNVLEQIDIYEGKDFNEVMSKIANDCRYDGTDMNIHGVIGDFEIFRMYIKNESFREEREWRVICNIHSSMQFRAARDRIIPYIDFPMDLNSIREVIIGPKNISRPIDVKRFIGRNDVSVKKSRSSYR